MTAGPFVADASLVFALAAHELPGESAEDAGRQIAEAGAIAPRHWPLEMANAFLMSLRRKRLTKAQVRAAAEAVGGFGITIDMSEVDAFGSLFELAERHRLTVYDAAYLELALRTGYALASLDGELRAAAKKEGVALLPA
ncbi:hypothetical protein sos41_41750 [Alphaproteobacteria bacterium SO-S41]|nr:hypothetical protein sos41_41750 [Alphaproteobacteria bacterium SO-S41]